jgi:carotenoid cleavage dioxygenase-like enzyme
MVAEAAAELPFHLRGNYAPVEKEVTAHDLPVEGAIPPELQGLFVRNGPNPRTPTNHWFSGEGMLHGVRLEAGRASWYRNRWVRTRVFEEGAIVVADDGTVDRTVGLANTHVIRHAGRTLALVESSFPTEVTAELDTVGTWDFDGRLSTAMTAHPKECPVTGELHFFGYGFAPPFLTYHRADSSGRLIQSEVIEVPGPTMIHDFAITERSVIFMDLPIVFSLDRVTEARFPYAWSDDYGARLGVMPRGGGADQVRWMEIDPCYVFHPLNAHEVDGRIVLDVARYPELWREASERFQSAYLHRFTIDPAEGSVSEEALDDLAIEFPRVDDRRTGRAARHGYAVASRSERGVEESMQLLVRYDLVSGSRAIHDFGAGAAASEAVFAAAGPGEADGWLLAYVYDAARDGSDLVILDADRIEAEPVARVALPQRVPFGFHGSWLADQT